MLSYEILDDVITFICVGRLDIANSSNFDNYFNKYYNGDRNVIINLRELSYINIIGLRSLTCAAKAVYATKRAINL
jgi:anti-anti-sigma regulatory factor